VKNRYITIVILLVLGHIFTELHTIIMWVNPKSVTYMVGDWFLKPMFSVPDLNILWYTKMVEDSFLLMVLLFAGACQSYTRNYKTYLEWQRFSMRLYVVWLLYFLYHCFDMVSFLYNYKTSYISYVVALCLVTAIALFVGFYKIKFTELDK
jgi:hypothetical protein